MRESGNREKDKRKSCRSGAVAGGVGNTVYSWRGPACEGFGDRREKAGVGLEDTGLPRGLRAAVLLERGTGKKRIKERVERAAGKDEDDRNGENGGEARVRREPYDEWDWRLWTQTAADAAFLC